MAKEAAGKVLSFEGREVLITHPDKLYFSSQARVSKLDLVRYYLSVAPGALAGIQDRPIVLKRFVTCESRRTRRSVGEHKAIYKPNRAGASSTIRKAHEKD